MTTSVLSQDLRLASAYVSNPMVLRNFDNWFASPYPVTLDLSSLNVSVQRADDGSTFLFLSFSPTFAIGGGLVDSAKEVYMLDLLDVIVVPVGGIASVASAVVPMASSQSADYTWTSGITVGGSIGLKGTGAVSEKDGPSAGVEVNLGATFSYTNEQSVSATIQDVGVNASLTGQAVNWTFSCQQVYASGKPVPYDVGSPHAALHNQIDGYRTPPAALRGAAGGVLTRCQAIWKLPPGAAGSTMFAIALQARLVHGYVDNNWGNTSTTWVSTPLGVTVDLDAGTATPIGGFLMLPMLITGGVGFHADGERAKVS